MTNIQGMNRTEKCNHEWKVTGMHFPSGKMFEEYDKCDLPKGHEGPHKHFCGVDYLSKQEIWSFEPKKPEEKGEE